MVRVYDHADVRVKSLAGARPLFDALLPAMGLSEIQQDAASAGYHVPGGDGFEPFIWLAEDPAHAPNDTRIAFPTYYAAFFEDASGNRFEICCRA